MRCGFYREIKFTEKVIIGFWIGTHLAVSWPNSDLLDQNPWGPILNTWVLGKKGKYPRYSENYRAVSWLGSYTLISIRSIPKSCENFLTTFDFEPQLTEWFRRHIQNYHIKIHKILLRLPTRCLGKKAKRSTISPKPQLTNGFVASPMKSYSEYSFSKKSRHQENRNSLCDFVVRLVFSYWNP